MLSIHVAVTKNVIKMNKSYCQTRLFMLYLNQQTNTCLYIGQVFDERE